MDPDIAPLAIVGSVMAIALPLLLQKPLGEYDMRLRTHASALSSFYLDALRGLIPVRAHGAGPIVRREHESLLVSWMGAGRALAQVATAIEALQASIGFALAIWMVERHMSHGHELGATLLALYWVLSIPTLGQEIVSLTRQYPTLKNVALRLLEPLAAREDVEASKEPSVMQNTASPSAPSSGGIAVAYEAVSVLAGIELAITPGAHVAVVGSLWRREVEPGRPFARMAPARERPDCGRRDTARGAGLASLRQETAWVDPAVQLWNRMLLSNLNYGGGGSATPLQEVIAATDLRGVLERLPDGLQTLVGESGAFCQVVRGSVCAWGEL